MGRAGGGGGWGVGGVSNLLGVERQRPAHKNKEQILLVITDAR